LSTAKRDLPRATRPLPLEQERANASNVNGGVTVPTRIVIGYWLTWRWVHAHVLFISVLWWQWESFDGVLFRNNFWRQAKTVFQWRVGVRDPFQAL